MKKILSVAGGLCLVLAAAGAGLEVANGRSVPWELVAAGLGGGLGALWAAAILDRLEVIAERLAPAEKPEARALYGQAPKAGLAPTPEETKAALAGMRAALRSGGRD
jgi:hypothetical protein